MVVIIGVTHRKKAGEGEGVMVNNKRMLGKLLSGRLEAFNKSDQVSKKTNQRSKENNSARAHQLHE